MLDSFRFRRQCLTYVCGDDYVVDDYDDVDDDENGDDDDDHEDDHNDCYV